MGSEFPSAAQRLNKKGVRFYALLAQANAPPLPTKPPVKPAPVPVARSSVTKAIDPVQPIRKPTAAEYLTGTPTLVVPNEILKTFDAPDFPLIVVVDHRGTIRAIQVAPQNALRPDYLVDQIADHVVKLWPPPAPREPNN